MFLRRVFLRLGEAVLDAAVAGLALGLAESVIVAKRAAPGAAELPAVVVATIGLALPAVLVLGTVLVVVLRLLARHPALVGIANALRGPGARRVEMLTTIGAVAVSLAVAWWVSARVATHAHVHYRLPEGAGILVATTAFAAIGGALFVSSLLGPALGRRLGRAAAAVRVTSGGAGVALAVCVAIGVALVVDRVVLSTIPSWDPVPASLRGLALVLVALAAGLHPSRRLGRTRATAACVMAAIAMVAAPVLLGHHDATRSAVLSRGVVAKLSVDVVHALFDGDGDGFADVLGMVDCDDTDPRIHPGAVERAGNGRDDDCVGGDADPASLAAARARRPSTTSGAQRFDIVIVSIDSLRADYTSIHGGAVATPALDALAARGTMFEHAYCASPTTRFALPALLFGRHPHTLPFTDDLRWPVLAPHELPTLAGELRAAGYRTAAVLPRAGLPLSDATFAGFDDVMVIEQPRPAQNVNDAPLVAARARAWLEAPHTAPRLLWAHIIEPHYPYEPSYADEIRASDDALGSIVAAIDPARTIVVVTGDHGEAFFDHHQRFHGSSLYEEETHVPLVIAVPGTASRRIDPPVSHVDVAPTLLDLTGQLTPAGMSGTSLAAAIVSGEPPAARSIVTALLPGPQSPRLLVAARSGDAVVIRDLVAWTVEVYDLARDPRERSPMRSGALVDRLVRELDLAVTHDLAVAPSR